jgi:beta-lactamase regulating signal transducer with metallopeptidase domain
MNNLIEILNHRGGDFLNFAGPMLWQSGLLISVLFAFEFLFRRKVRASIRYLLWLVVLIKLCVPPTFALPTSPAWWLHKTPVPVAAKAEPRYTVTYDSTPLPEISPTPTTAFVPPKATLTKAAGLLLAAATVSVALLCWLLVRWWQITMQIRRAPGSGRLTALAGEMQKCLGTKFRVQVKLTPNSMSPAVCGLFRPVILIPQSLAENFPDEQLRAVLLHELIHLRRRDVWLNFFQALLQIAYWWHPLVWLANAHIRRVREEAVDDAVMLALRDEAESYAPTLLEVAKLALNRPLASLGLVGILESRHALRQRIERLVDFRPPRQAGLTLVSIFGILAFTAVAVPMGEGPTPAENKILFAPAPAVSAQPAVLQKTNLPSILVTTHFYRALPAEFEKIAAPL